VGGGGKGEEEEEEEEEERVVVNRSNRVVWGLRYEYSKSSSKVLVDTYGDGGNDYNGSKDRKGITG